MKVTGLNIEDIETQQLIWYGHVRRIGEERLQKDVLERTTGIHKISKANNF